MNITRDNLLIQSTNFISNIHANHKLVRFSIFFLYLFVLFSLASSHFISLDFSFSLISTALSLLLSLSFSLIYPSLSLSRLESFYLLFTVFTFSSTSLYSSPSPLACCYALPLAPLRTERITLYRDICMGAPFRMLWCGVLHAFVVVAFANRRKMHLYT